MQKEPRIEKLNAHEQFDDEKKYGKHGSVVSHSEKRELICEITFSDSTEISFKNINDLKEIETNKDFFMNKMSELEQVKENAIAFSNS